MTDVSALAFAIPPPSDGAPAPSASTASSSRSDKPSKKRKATTTSQGAPAQESFNETETETAEGAAEEEEERPLSHKEKRQAKKRKLAEEASGITPAAAPTPSAPAPALTTIGNTLIGNTPSRSAHGVWVGNMNFATHARELLAWFAQKGLQEVSRINMPNGKRAHENNRGFAYLDFPSATDVTIAVGLSEQHLDGRKLLIKSSSDYTGRPAPSTSTPADSAAAPPVTSDEAAPASASSDPTPAHLQAQTLNRTARRILDKQRNPAGPTLFLGNLGFETKVEDIREMFDRNQVRQAEWEPKVKGKKGEKSGKKPEERKGKAKAKAGSEDGEDDDEDQEEVKKEAKEEQEADTDRDDDDSDSGSDSSDSDEEEGEKENEGIETKKKGGKDKKEKGEKGALNLANAKDAGIRKIRLGTFEDSGKCKGWCFVDFHLPAQATRALLNTRNHSLNGRKLNVEYASADAVRRGGLGSRATSKAHGRQKREGGDREQGNRGQKRGREGEQGGWNDDRTREFASQAGHEGEFGERDAAPPHARGGKGSFERGERRGGDRDGGRDNGGKRMKSGAALAMAQRASDAIVESTGRKTTFD
ncbi:hypothetical protein JCM11641_005391 [Rhodosporidiobolus odoratus]